MVCCGTGLALLLLLGCGGPPAKPQPPKLLVRAEPLRRAEVAPRIQVTGTVTAIEQSRVASGASGIVMTYPFQEGDYVEAGAVLAELRSVTIGIELESARATLRERQQKFAELEAGYRPEELSAAEAAMKSAEAQERFAKSKAERARELHERKALSDEQFDQSVYEADKAEQDRRVAESDYQMKSQGYRSEQVEAAKAARDAQTQVVRQLEDELGKRTIRAPFAGFLVSEETDVGQWVPEGGTVATLLRLDQVEVRVNVEEHEVEHIRPGQEVEVRIDSARPSPFTGRVTQVVPRSQWETGSRSFPVIVQLTNEIVAGEPLLKEGMLARIEFVGDPRDALLAPKDAIVRTTTSSLVYVVGQDRHVRAVTIEEGLAEGEFLEVRGELREGDLLVNEGVERLRPYDEVELIEQPQVASGPRSGEAASSHAPSAGG